MAIFSFGTGVLDTDVYGALLAVSVSESLALTETPTTRIRMTYAEDLALSETLTTKIKAVLADDVTFEELEAVRLRATYDEDLDVSEESVCKYYAKLILMSRITRALHLDSHIAEG